MNIHSLTISGFKSFGKKTEFVFSKAITGIVGPNGSGKSNITEAMRFVLGEQSFKSIRTKEVTDLLFRGADSKANMLSVTVKFTETAGCAQDTDSILIKNTLEKGEVEVTRQVFADGKNLYKINNQEVRLKDIQELLLLLGISSKSSWHISQGESDRILLANKEERKSLIEDALGLRIYHTKIDDSTRKLEKANANINEALLKRKEILPDIQNLEREINRIEKAKIYRQELISAWSVYSNKKNKTFSEKLIEINQLGSIQELQKQNEDLQRQMQLEEKSLYESGEHDTTFLENKKQEEEKILQVLNSKKRELDTKAQQANQKKIYLEIEEQKAKEELTEILNDLQKLTGESNEILFKEKDVHILSDQLLVLKNQIESSNDIQIVRESFYSAMNHLAEMIGKGSLVSNDNLKEVSYLNTLKERLEQKLQKAIFEREELQKSNQDIFPELEKLDLQLKIVNENISKFHTEIIEFKFRQSERTRGVENIKSGIRDLQTKIEKRNYISSVFEADRKEFELKEWEIRQIFGQGFNFELENSDSENTQNIHELERSIERLKLKIEESNVKNGEEIIEQHKTLKERDVFLLKEIEDLSQSITNLENIIKDLKDRLKADFESGVDHINGVFDGYVKKLFGGGSGKVMIVNSQKSKKDNSESSDSNESLETENQDDEEMESGIDIEVELPKKKVKGLHSLSGGERALVSIALTVSIFNQNGSPFMILDEADATLDEANAKRYGELLELIKEKTKLIVVTHNRETMSFADEVYGITLEKTGASKVLSVSFVDALEYAK